MSGFDPIYRRQWVVRDLIAAGYADADGVLSYDAIQEASGYTPEDFKMFVTDPISHQIDRKAFDDAISDAMSELGADTGAELIWRYYVDKTATGGATNPLYEHVYKTCAANGFAAAGHITPLGSTLLAGIASQDCQEGEDSRVAVKRAVLAVSAPNELVALYILARDKNLIHDIHISQSTQRTHQSL